jgi:O-antigen/teichoic acid export membrane protein
MRRGDPQFDKLLLLLGLISPNSMESDKKFLFYYVCIVVRFIIYSLTLIFYDYKYLPYIILFASLLSAINLSSSLLQAFNDQWWSKKFQLAVAILLMIISVLLIFNVITNTYIIPIILYISLFVGILQSLAT